MSRKNRNSSPMTRLLSLLAAVLILVFVLVLIRYYRGEDESSEISVTDATEKLQTETLVIKTEDQTEVMTEEESSDRLFAPETKSEALPETEEADETEGMQLTVAIDPGHQGSWVDMSEEEPIGPGASETKAKSSTGTQGTYSGLSEYELNLEISQKLKTELIARGYEVVMTREDNDTAISNSERALKASEEGGDIYVRIHANGSEDPQSNGALAMVPSPDNPYVAYLAEDSYLLADCILSAYCEEAGFASLGIQYYDDMSGINWSRIPVMILEMGFMTNEFDDLKMADPETQTRMVNGIADGIDAYFEEKGLLGKAESGTESPALTERMNTILEIVGEVYLYPAMDSGEDWAVSIADLSSGEETDLNGDEKMKAASLAKLFVMAAVYERILYPPSGEEISADVSDEELKSLLSAMISASDNDAANTLLTYLGEGDAHAGLETVNRYLAENGYENTHMGRLFLEEDPADDNFTSANDCRKILKAIREGSCVNEEASGEMLDFLRQQTRTEKIPAGVKDAQTANKTGELAGEYGDYVESDAAVIDLENESYILCVLSQNLNDSGEARSRITGISEAVWQILGEEK